MCRAGRWLWTGGLRALGGCRQELAAGLCALGLLKGFLGQHVVLGQAEGRLGTYAVMGESRARLVLVSSCPCRSLELSVVPAGR